MILMFENDEFANASVNIHQASFVKGDIQEFRSVKVLEI